MRELDLVDRLYEAFVGTLDERSAQVARRLAHTLGLAPSPDIPWSQVFGHEVTLAAPALVAEAMPHLANEKVRWAVLAHALAVIEAFVTDRIEDGQVDGTDDLLEIVVQLQRHRSLALARLSSYELPVSVRYDNEDRTMRNAIASERELFLCGRSTTMRTYELMSLGKQSVGFPACMALAWAAGWDTRRRAVLRRLLANVWLGLQMNDDVVDWEGDLSRGGAWAVSLMRGVLQDVPTDERPTEGLRLRNQVLKSGVLRTMLARSKWHFRAARLRSQALGAHSLATWAGTQEGRLGGLVQAEERSAGYAARAHALAAWASEVLT